MIDGLSFREDIDMTILRRPPTFKCQIPRRQESLFCFCVWAVYKYSAGQRQPGYCNIDLSAGY